VARRAADALKDPAPDEADTLADAMQSPYWLTFNARLYLHKIHLELSRTTPGD
jgi:hypothetical protein